MDEEKRTAGQYDYAEEDAVQQEETAVLENEECQNTAIAVGCLAAATVVGGIIGMIIGRGSRNA